MNWLRGLGRGNDPDLRESVEEVLEEHADAGSGLEPEQREMLLNILDFDKLDVDDVMVPRADIIAIALSASLDEVVETFRQAHHSRLPVYRGTFDDVVGFIHIKDIMQFWNDGDDFTLQAILREPLVVPHSMLITDLLPRMQVSRIHMAIVVDEYGGGDGLVTIEDLVEEIVGEIEDEHDKVEPPMMKDLGDGKFDLDARMELEDFEEEFGVDLLSDEEDEDVDTLGGLVFAMAGRVPEVGDRLLHECGFEFEITEADPRRIIKLMLRTKVEAEKRGHD